LAAIARKFLISHGRNVRMAGPTNQNPLESCMDIERGTRIKRVQIHTPEWDAVSETIKRAMRQICSLDGSRRFQRMIFVYN
jgi:hypothetical protein